MAAADEGREELLVESQDEAPPAAPRPHRGTPRAAAVFSATALVVVALCGAAALRRSSTVAADTSEAVEAWGQPAPSSATGAIVPTAPTGTLAAPPGPVAQVAPAAPVGDACAAFGCKGGCGNCFNPDSRGGKVCNGKGGQTGYYCPPDPENAGGGEATFACMDWTFGSSSVRAAEASFSGRSGEDVYLGVGTWGSAEGLGACYRLKVEGVDKDIIGQSLNTGHDVAGNQFDLQIGAGGAGAFNTCAGGTGSMYPGGVEPWGCQYGGVDSREECAGLPEFPQDSAAMRANGDSLIKLCEYGWDKKVRLSGAGRSAGRCKYNPTILDAARVRCPEELVNLTQIQRVDDPKGYKEPSAPGFPNLDMKHKCTSQVPGQGVAYCLSRMMDCRKPSGGFKDNVKSELMVHGKKLVQTCTADGYTRINVACGCKGCYC